MFVTVYGTMEQKKGDATCRMPISFTFSCRLLPLNPQTTLEFVATLVATNVAAVFFPALALSNTQKAAVKEFQGGCIVSHVEKLDPSMSPLSFGFGDPVGYYYRGCAIIALVVYALFFTGPLLISKSLTLMGYERLAHMSLQKTRHPITILVPMGTFHLGLLYCSFWLLLNHPSPMMDIPIGVVGLVSTCVLVAWVLLRGTCYLKCHQVARNPAEWHSDWRLIKLLLRLMVWQMKWVDSGKKGKRTAAGDDATAAADAVELLPMNAPDKTDNKTTAASDTGGAMLSVSTKDSGTAAVSERREPAAPATGPSVAGNAQGSAAAQSTPSPQPQASAASTKLTMPVSKDAAAASSDELLPDTPKRNDVQQTEKREPHATGNAQGSAAAQSTPSPEPQASAASTMPVSKDAAAASSDELLPDTSKRNDVQQTEKREPHATGNAQKSVAAQPPLSTQGCIAVPATSPAPAPAFPDTGAAPATFKQRYLLMLDDMRCAWWIGFELLCAFPISFMLATRTPSNCELQLQILVGMAGFILLLAVAVRPCGSIFGTVFLLLTKAGALVTAALILSKNDAEDRVSFAFLITGFIQTGMIILFFFVDHWEKIVHYARILLQRARDMCKKKPDDPAAATIADVQPTTTIVNVRELVQADSADGDGVDSVEGMASTSEDESQEVDQRSQTQHLKGAQNTEAEPAEVDNATVYDDAADGDGVDAVEEMASTPTPAARNKKKKETKVADREKTDQLRPAQQHIKPPEDKSQEVDQRSQTQHMKEAQNKEAEAADVKPRPPKKTQLSKKELRDMAQAKQQQQEILVFMEASKSKKFDAAKYVEAMQVEELEMREPPPPAPPLHSRSSSPASDASSSSSSPPSAFSDRSQTPPTPPPEYDSSVEEGSS